MCSDGMPLSCLFSDGYSPNLSPTLKATAQHKRFDKGTMHPKLWLIEFNGTPPTHTHSLLLPADTAVARFQSLLLPADTAVARFFRTGMNPL
jgi:hypothetical protein